MSNSTSQAAEPGWCKSKRDWLLMGIVLTSAAAVRLPSLFWSLWYDEIFSVVHFFRLPLREIGNAHVLFNNHILYSMLANISVALLGEGEWTVRLPAFLCAVLSVPLLHCFIRRHAGSRVAWAGTLLLIVSPMHLRFATQARGYGLMILLTVVSIIGFIEWFVGKRARFLFLMAGANILLGYTHLVGLAVPLAEVTTFFVGLVLTAVRRTLQRKEKRQRSHRDLGESRGQFLVLSLQFAAAELATLTGLYVLYRPILPRILATASSRSPASIDSGDFALSLFSELSGLSGFGSMALIMCLLSVWGLLTLPRHLRLLIAVTYSLVLSLLLVAAVRPPAFLYVRFFLFLLPFHVIVMAAGVAKAAETLLRAPLVRSRVSLNVVTALLTVALLLGQLPQVRASLEPVQDFKSAAAYVQESLLPGDVLVLGPFGAAEFCYYLSEGVQERHLRRPRSADTLTAWCSPGRRVWYVASFNQRGFENPDIQQWIRDQFVLVRTFESHPDVNVWLYGSVSEEEINEEISSIRGRLATGGTADDYFHLGNACLTLGRWEDAVSAYGQAIDASQSPESPIVYLSHAFTGEAYGNSGRHEEAAASYRRALEVMSGDQEIRQDVMAAYLACFEAEELPDDIGDNLLNNAGFEDDLQNWSAHRPSGEQASFSLDPDSRHEGAQSALISGHAPDYHGGWLQGRALKSGTAYLYSAWVKTQDEGGLKVTLLYREHYVDGKPNGRGSEELEGSTDWILRWVTFTAQESDDNRVVLYPVLVSGQGRVWVDDVQLVALSGVQETESVEDKEPSQSEVQDTGRERRPVEVGENLIVNGGFEGGREGWQIHDPSGDAEYLIDDTRAIEGQRSGLTRGARAERLGGWYQSIKVKEGTPYLFSFHVEAEDEQGLQGRLLCWEVQVDGQYNQRCYEEFSGDVDWTHKWTVLMAPESADGFVTFYPVQLTGKGDVWIDDVQLVELAGSRPLEAYEGRTTGWNEPASGAGDNLFSNGGFEDGAEGWGVYNRSGEATFLVDGAEATEGHSSGLIEGSSGSYHGGWNQPLQLRPNAIYLFSCYVRTEGEQGFEGRVLYWETYLNGQPGGRSAGEFSGSMEWAHQWTVFVAPESDDNVVRLYPVLVTGQGKVWIDDVRLMELSGVQP